MKLPLIACMTLPLALAACAERQTETTTIVSSVTPEQRQACVGAAAAARGIPEALVTATSATATPTGPVVNLSIGSDRATCKLDELGAVEDVTFGEADAITYEG